ncbi:MAG: Omp28-related outer membrane protein [Flavobacteriales bacterium]|nr:Omp28-related outer membrane protein [Flavobacteriales bacterium]
MKKLFSALFVFAIFWSCSEVPPFINYAEDIKLSVDTCFVSGTLPDKQDKNVLVEDISGVRCVNCPEAAASAHEIDLLHPNRIVIATLHPTSNVNLTTPIGNDTFNTQEAENIYQNIIGGSQGLPAGAVDRKKFDGEARISVAPSKWKAYAEQQLQLKSDVNLDLQAIGNKAERNVELTVNTIFTEDLNYPVHMTIMVLESKLVQPQATRSGIEEDYEHEDVLRFTYTNYSGLKLSDAPQSGLNCTKGFNVKIPEKLVWENVSIAVIIHRFDSEGKDVLHCKEVHLD